MLSGNGRHRRPRQAPALLVAAGVTGSAIAIPLLGASGASAADGTTWDRVAECETGGAWSAYDGYGHFGGLALTQPDWENHGGLEYAPSPEQASRQQQIAVAERILADQGVAAWPACGPLSGLGQDSAPAEVDTGVAGDESGGSGLTDTSDSSASSGSSSPSTGTPSTKSDKSADGAKKDTSADSDAGSEGDEESGSDTSPAPSGSREPDSARTETFGDEADKSGENATSSDTTAGAGTGRHRGGSADEEAVTDGREGGSTGRHASRSGAAARDAADGEYTVLPGDSLWSIADSLELQGGWSGLYAENQDTVGADPDLIVPGQTLTVEGETDEK
ncbi:transglycosylase family protein [Streptomyces sp. NPDC093094]|uniref:transglycosylase family protein n=1 Tax=Streptomyces sp. NPDC093094 TaxID=3366026 RepID=UPI00382557D4